MKTNAVQNSTTPTAMGGKRPQGPTGNPRRNFWLAAVNMGWQLIIVVLVPVIGGAELDKHNGGKHVWVFVGLAIAFLASAAVMWRAIQLANRLPVPKLTDAQRRAIQKSYEEDDE